MKARWYMAAGALLLASVLLALPGRPAAAADFNGDGTGDIAIFRPASGLWAVRGVTRLYFGSSGDLPVPGDYNGSRIDAPAVFRPASGLWAVRGVTRVYFGGSADQPRPGDFTGDGTTDFAIFRPNTRLWAVRGVTRFYFGGTGDTFIDPGPPSRRGLLRTGQTTKYRDFDDGDYQAGAAFSYYTMAPHPIWTDEVVTVDRATGLMWASDGFSSACYSGQTANWATAVTYAAALDYAGYTDWRLPNLRELESIRDIGRQYPTIDLTYFPNTLNRRYWSSSSASNVQAYLLDFERGHVLIFSKTDNFYLRPVRGGR